MFVGLFLLTRALQRQRGLSAQERMSNVLDLVGKAAERKLDQGEKKHALELLDGVDPGDPLYEPVRRLMEEADTTPAPEPSRLARGAKALGDRYFWLLERPWFRPALVSVFALWALLSISSIVALVFSLGGGRAGFGSDALTDLNFINVASLASSGASALLVGVGFWRLRRRDRRGAYRMFERALLISVFLTRVFAFVESEFSAVFGLGVDLLLLITLRYAMRQDRRLEPGELPPAPVRRPGRESRARPA